MRKAFTAALLAKSNLVLAEENMKSFQEVENLSRTRFQKGEISGADMLKIELQKLQIESDVQDAALRLKTAKMTLRALLATPALAEDFDVEGEFTFTEFDPPLADLKELAIRNRPDLHSAETLTKKAEADVRLAIANGYTDLYLSIGYHHTEPSLPTWIHPLFPQGPSEDSVGLGVSFPIRIFDRNEGEIARTRAEATRVARWPRLCGSRLVMRWRPPTPPSGQAENGLGYSSRSTWQRDGSYGRSPNSPTIAAQRLFWTFWR